MSDVALGDAMRRSHLRPIPSDDWGPPEPAPGWDDAAQIADLDLVRVPLKTFGQFISEYAPLAYAIEPIARTGSLYTLTAKTGAGKTAWMISASMAVATGRGDILNLEVEQGRVAFLTFENPDDVRMRLMIAAYLFNIDIQDIDSRLMILDARVKPEAVLIDLREASVGGNFRLIFVDTLAAFFDGDDVNNAVQGGEFIRRMRPMTQLPGLPSVIVAAHPVKNATEEQLVPYGSGAILNEVDGNLTLWRRPETGTVKLYWQGKLRGLEFNLPEFRFEISGSPDVLDAKGREVQLPTLLSYTISDSDLEAKVDAEKKARVAVLRALKQSPGGSLRKLAELAGCSKSRVEQLLKDFDKKKLAECAIGGWIITPKGDREVTQWG